MVRKLSMDNAVETAQFMVTEYCRGNDGPLFSALAQDCVWVLPEGPALSGAEAVRSYRSGLGPMRVEEAEFRRIETGGTNLLGVYGSYALVPETRGGRPLRQRVTLLFRKEARGFRLCYLHASNDWTRWGDRTDDQGSERVESPKRLFVFRCESATYCFDLESVLYVEATGKGCTVYMTGRTMTVRQPIRALAAQFPRQFCRIHRSYLVNCRFVTEVRRYAVTLADGTVLPVPEKRYKEVRDGVSARLAHLERDEQA